MKRKQPPLSKHWENTDGDPQKAFLAAKKARREREQQNGENHKIDTSIKAPVEELVTKIQKMSQQFRPEPETRLQVIDFDNLMRLLHYQFQVKFRGKNVQFATDEQTSMLYTIVALYFSGDPRFETLDTATGNKASLQKGLTLMGGIGIGKTIVMNLILAIKKRLNRETFTDGNGQRFQLVLHHPINLIVDAHRFTDKYNANENLLRYYKANGLFIDDVGRERAAQFVRGQNYYPLELIFDQRYRRYMSSNCITHITTNLSFAELEFRYKNYVTDRLVEMQNTFSIDAVSKRHQNQHRNISHSNATSPSGTLPPKQA